LNILGIIPARAGSKRVKDKNIRPFAGKTLTHLAIEQALEAKCLDRIIVSSDSDKVLSIAKTYKKVEVLKRPSDLASDTAPAIDYMKHAINNCETQGWNPDLVVIIQPTSPIRNGENIDNTIDILRKNIIADSAVSIVKLPHDVHPHKFKTLDAGMLKPWLFDEGQETAEKDLPEIYIRNCAVYVFKVKNLKKDITFGEKCIGYKMKSESAVDINDMLDFEFAEYLIKKINK
jgi:CMP-N,N'-diacetyllegionaminic acid synthase